MGQVVLINIAVITCSIIVILSLRASASSIQSEFEEDHNLSVQDPGIVCLISEAPNIVLLDSPPIDLFNKIPTRNELVKIGTKLLHDLNGNKLTKIVEDHTNDGVYGIAREIFKQWLQDKGQHPVTWNTLITTLKENQLLALATHIQSSVDERVINTPSNSFAYSDIIHETADFLKEVYSDQRVIELNLLNSVGNLPFFDIVVNNSSKYSSTLWRSFFGQMNRPQRLLITGHPGAGKTTLLRYLAKKWAEGRDLKECEILFLIHLGEIKRRGAHSWNSLSDMLKYYFKDMKGIDDVAKEITSRHGAGACFLLDAYDEWYDDDFVYDLIFRQRLKKSFCILTSRYNNIMTADEELIKRVEIIGYEDSKLNHYLRVLSNNNHVTESVRDLWVKYPSVTEMCRVPLHLAMVIYIMKHDDRPHTHAIITRAQIYTAFMNVTIKHYEKTHHPNWNTVSLRNCILETSSDELCIAFKTLRSVAFEILFKHIASFPEHPEIQRHIKNLGFLNIEREHSTRDQVYYTFSHPTFLEFFAVLHLITLTQNEQLMYINLYGRECKNNLLTLFFELVVDLYPERVLEAGIVTKRSATQMNSWQPFPAICRFTYNEAFLMTVAKATDGWKSEDFTTLLQTAGIIVNHSLCVQDSSSRVLIKDVLKHTNLHKLQFKGENDCTNYIVTLEDPNQPLTGESLDNLYRCLNGQIQASHCPTFTSVKSFKLSIKNVALQSCITFELVTRCFPNLSLLHVECSDDNVLLLQDKINSLSDIHTELTITFNDCELLSSEYVVTCLELFPRIKGVHLISDCDDIENDTITFERLPYHISMLPQYQSISITHNIPSFLYIFNGQSELRHIHLRGLNMGLWSESNVNKFLQWIEASRYLETLEIAYTNFPDTEFELPLHHLPLNLSSLNLDGNGIADQDLTYILRAMERIPKLNHLSLKDNWITNVGANKLAHSIKPNKNLESLDLSNNPTSDFGHLTQLTNLKYLAFNGCSVHDEHSAVSGIFRSLPELQSLHLCKKNGRQRKSDNFTLDYGNPCCTVDTSTSETPDHELRATSTTIISCSSAYVLNGSSLMLCLLLNLVCFMFILMLSF